MKNKEFFVAYIDGSLGTRTKKTLRRFAFFAFSFLVIGGLIFSFIQKPFKNSTFELSELTKITGTFHISPYPMLRVKINDTISKNVLLLGFGKSSVNPYLRVILEKKSDLQGQTLTIEGNLIFYNGKTLLQVIDENKVSLTSGKGNLPQKTTIGEAVLKGEIVDPKCYFGVMKPGFGKIHRSCAIRCISGGIPPVFVSTQKNISEYYLLTDLDGKPINQEVLPFIGKPSEITGLVEKLDDWYLLKIDIANIRVSNNSSSIYSK
ncbi:hypothetical protein SAMN04489761_0814 [Tenacibaculum sp. MAR_2009_124]|uniref:hypothetical protein n=1 Tax=Tenacibaculum sp. MAR_2009_124 TaxID=1250059 RepID=UPI00089702A2|nr:hypothetical protein [Tenacibaculum sp. MAR_2009_124]SEB45419.1 hypothetical protein SAMN04489761_0814 [Tenacibaculum sp. MAR_2009_124]